MRHLLDGKGHDRPLNEEAMAAKAAPDTLVVLMSKLRLSGTERELRYLEIRTEDGFINTADGYQTPNDEEQKVMQRLGYTAENLTMLHDSTQKVQTIRLFVLNPAYVQEEAARDSKKSSFWRASRLNVFYGGSNFDAVSRDVDDQGHLRGVRRGEVRSTAAPERVVPGAPVAASEIKVPTMSDILAVSRQYVAPHSWDAFQTEVEKLYVTHNIK